MREGSAGTGCDVVEYLSVMSIDGRIVSEKWETLKVDLPYRHLGPTILLVYLPCLTFFLNVTSDILASRLLMSISTSSKTLAPSVV